jgi:repressor LexA
MKIYTTRWRIVEFIRNFVEKHGYAPTIAEIRKGLDISSNSVVKYHLDALEEEGIIDRVPEAARAMHISGVGKRARATALLGAIPAGEPIPVPTEDTWHTIPQETVEVPADMVPSNVRVFALRVQGISMIDALVDDGDIIVLEATARAENGQMVAAWLKDRQETTLKKIYYEPDRIRLQPANKSIAPIYVDPDKLLVQGRVIAVLRKLW